MCMKMTLKMIHLLWILYITIKTRTIIKFIEREGDLCNIYKIKILINKKTYKYIIYK